MKLVVAILILGTASSWCLAAAADQWQAVVTDEGCVEISARHAPVVRSEYALWGKDWDWASVKIRLDPVQPGPLTFRGAASELGLAIRGKVTTPTPNQLRFEWNIEASRDLRGIIGGGLEFNLELQSSAIKGGSSDPTLLPNNLGWQWPVAPGERVRVEFDEPAHHVYFERDRKHRIRTAFIGETVSKGLHRVVMTVSLPKGGTIGQTPSRRYGPADPKNWYAGAMRHDRSPVDLSHLNHKPAGRHGFVRAKGDALVFADGTPARFWGGNLAAYAIDERNDRIEIQAKRIAQLGYNLMRIHHHDSMGWVRHTVIGRTRPDSQYLDGRVMDRLDYWIKCLKDEGVYVWLDLHVGRLFKPGDNVGEGYAEMLRRGERGNAGAEAKGYCYFNDRIEQLMKEFNEKYLNHVNRYTALAYKDDPAVMGLLVTNENDLTSHFGNLMLPDKNNPHHNRIFEAAVTAFARKHGLARNKTWQTWVPGPSKLFLADWEFRWQRRMLDHLQSLGVKVPVATTQMWGDMALFGLPPLTTGGIVDVHAYGESEALNTNPRHQSNYVAYMASGAAYGKPVAITEWNVPYPATDRFTAPLYVASIAALQGWDAPMIYNYSQRNFERPTSPSTWSSFPDPALTGMMPAAALVYRQAHVSPAKQTYCLKLDRKALYYRDSRPENVATLRTLVEQSKVTIGFADVKELDWDGETRTAANVHVLTDLQRDFIAPGREDVTSDTGELSRNWVDGVQRIDTPKTQAAHGFIGGKPLRLTNVTLNVTTPKAAVAVSSLDGQPIGRSHRMLITAIARVVASEGNRMPLLSEPVRGRLTVAGPPGLRLVPLAGDAAQLEPVPIEYQNGRYAVALPVPRGTHWFLLAE